MHDWIEAHFPDVEREEPGDAFVRLTHALGAGLDRDPELSRLSGEALFFDLETLGFVGQPFFLIGLLRLDAGGARLVQLLARDYTEEEAVLRAFVEVGSVARLWVSFNGKSFDLPSLRRRAAFYRIRLPEPEEHLDLVYPSRRLYRGVLPNCRLKTLEERIFSRRRHRDLDGGEIPAAYHAFVRTGRGDDMARILRHNRDDLLTLARLYVHLEVDGTVREGPENLDVR